MPRYHLFGLSVRAEAPLPGLAPEPVSPGAPDVTLGALAPGGADAFGPPWYVSEHLSETGEPVLVIRRAADGALHLRYADGTEFAVDAGARRVRAGWPSGVTAEDAATYLLGPVLGLVLRLRGATCLHAAAVAVDGGAVLLAGPSGAGKSTTAAAFARAGDAVLADDVAPVRSRADGGFEVVPAHPHLRLWPDSAEALFGHADALPRLTPGWEKRYLDLAGAGRFHAAPLPLAAVCLLDERRGGAPRVETAASGRAAAELAANVYLGWLPDPALRARDLRFAAAVAAAIPVLRVTPPADPARLPELREAVLSAVRAARPA